MNYTLTENGGIKAELENGFMMFLPPENNGTPEWRQYQEWLDAGNTPNPYVKPGYETLSSAKETKIREIKQQAYQLLSLSDWMVVRAAEGGTNIPEEWSSYRSGIRAESDQYVSQINSATTIEEIIELVPSWSVSPQ